MEYISEKISISEVSKWKFGDKILITGQTGRGKSHFVKTTLLGFCKQNNYKMLLLSNRNILRNQNEEEMREDGEYIFMMNYQKIESGIIQTEEDLDYYLSRFQVVVFDEAHYFLSDSEFNRRTDLLLETLYKKYPDKIMLFITATPEILLEFQPDFDKTYTIKKDYSYIKNIYFFNRDNTPEAIIQNLPADEKIIFFSSDAQEAYNLSQRFSNSAFVCSESNPMYKYSDNITVNEIVEKSFFSTRILATTKVLDNGVNIVDPLVRHVIIDMLDLISLIQCLGRKRVTSKDDTINLYIRNYHPGNINFSLMGIQAKLQKVLQLDELGVEEFQRRHRKRSFHDIIDNDFQINKAKLQFFQYQSEWMKQLLKERDGYKNAVVKYLGINPETVKNADHEFEKISIKAYLEKMKNKKLFKEEQEEFKTKFFSLIFSPKNTNYRNRGIKSINAILEEDNIPYRLTSGKENSKKDRNKRWWAIIETNQFEEYE